MEAVRRRDGRPVAACRERTHRPTLKAVVRPPSRPGHESRGHAHSCVSCVMRQGSRAATASVGGGREGEGGGNKVAIPLHPAGGGRKAGPAPPRSCRDQTQRRRIRRFADLGTTWSSPPKGLSDTRETVWRPRPESNRGARICSPLRNHSATRPRCGSAPARGRYSKGRPAAAMEHGAKTTTARIR